MSVNRLMCSIHQTLYTSSTKQESALYARTIVPLKVAEKASYKLLQEKNSPQQLSSGEQRRIEQENPHVQRGGGGRFLVMLNYSRDSFFLNAE